MAVRDPRRTSFIGLNWFLRFIGLSRRSYDRQTQLFGIGGVILLHSVRGPLPGFEPEGADAVIPAAFKTRCTPMSQTKPTDDPRQRTDWKTTKQTDEPWKGPVEKEQEGGARKEDLERWQETSTH